MTTDHSELDTPGHDDSVDDHAHDEEPLGPIDLASWGAGALGIVVGVAVALCFALATA